MTFDQPRAEALRTAVIGTAQTLRHYPEGDAKTLLTEHLALLQEAELIFLTDAFVEEESHDVKYDSEQIFPDISELDRAAGRVNLRKTDADPHAELRKTWAPGQRWQARAWRDGVWGEWTDANSGGPLWFPHQQYRRHPDDIDQPKPWYPDDSGEWIEVPDDCMTCPVDGDTRIEYLAAYERSGANYIRDVIEADELSWGYPAESSVRIVSYKVVK